jgi:hypothetical protein
VTHTGRQLTSSSVTLTECGVGITTTTEQIKQLEVVHGWEKHTTIQPEPKHQENTSSHITTTLASKPKPWIESLEAEEEGKVE